MSCFISCWYFGSMLVWCMLIFVWRKWESVLLNVVVKWNLVIRVVILLC